MLLSLKVCLYQNPVFREIEFLGESSFSENRVFREIKSSGKFQILFYRNPPTPSWSYDKSILGAQIYGRVQVDPVQSLGSGFSVHIEKVFLCSGRDGYIPKYQPANSEYGCLADAPNLLYRFKVIVSTQTQKIFILNSVFGESSLSGNQIISENQIYRGILFFGISKIPKQNRFGRNPAFRRIECFEEWSFSKKRFSRKQVFGRI